MFHREQTLARKCASPFRKVAPCRRLARYWIASEQGTQVARQDRLSRCQRRREAMSPPARRRRVEPLRAVTGMATRMDHVFGTLRGVAKRDIHPLPLYAD